MYTKMTALFSLSLRVSANSLAHTCLHKTQYCFAKKPSNWCETFNLFTSAPLHRLSWNHHDSFQCHPLMSRPLLHQLLSKHLGKHFHSNEDNDRVTFASNQHNYMNFPTGKKPTLQLVIISCWYCMHDFACLLLISAKEAWKNSLFKGFKVEWRLFIKLMRQNNKINVWHLDFED